MTCGLFVDNPTVVTGPDGKRRLVARGGRLCDGEPGEAAISVTVRLRHHRRFQRDRTLAEITESGLSIDTGVAYECRGTSGIKVFTEAIGGGHKRKSETLYWECSD
jgi:hypothetical protein